MSAAIEVPARAYSLACDPRANAVPAVQGWPSPHRRRSLRGAVYVYPGETGAAVVAHLRRLGHDLVHDVEPATRAEGRLLLRAADRIDSRRRPHGGARVGMLHAGSFQRG